MKRIIAFCIVLLTATLVHAQGPLEGGFTPSEKTSMESLRQALVNTLTLVQKFCIGGSEVDCLHTMDAAFDFAQASGWLMHVNVNPNDAAGDAILAGPRSAVVAVGFAELDRAVLNLQRATGFSAKTEYAAALAKASAVDRTLAYATPWPLFVPCCGGTVIGTDPENQFGPHGQYSAAQKDLWKTMQYAWGALASDYPDSSDGWLRGQLAGTLPVCNALHAGMALYLIKTVGQIWFMSAGVLDDSSTFSGFRTDAEETLDPLAKKALTEIHLMNGPSDSPASVWAIKRISFAGADAGSCLNGFALSPASAPYIYRFLLNYRDSWDDADDWNGAFNVIR